jgi:hypothetical protein
VLPFPVLPVCVCVGVGVVFAVFDVQPATLTISTARMPSIKTIFNVILIIYRPLDEKNKSKA